MATDLKYFQAPKISDILNFLEVQSIDSTKVKYLYYDEASGMHTLWYAP